MKKLYCIKDRERREIVKSGLTYNEAVEFLDQMYDVDWCYAENLFIDKE